MLSVALVLLLYRRLGEICGKMERLAVRFEAGRLWRIGARAAVYGSQLRMILEQPEMVALLTASPQAGRVLRPRCRMLAVETSLLRPGVVKVAVPAVAKVKTTRVRKKRAPVDWGRIPLPRGVLAAAGFWKGASDETPWRDFLFLFVMFQGRRG